MPELVPASEPRRGWLLRSGTLWVVLLAAALRLGLVAVSPGGFRGSYGYDASVYYAAADALLHGRLPYRDFLMLHPPGVMIALAPFAALGELLGDHTGFMIGNAAFTLLGAFNAGLVVLVARRLQLPERAALLGGLFYAVWFGAVEAEISARLEPLGTFLFLCGLLLVAGDQAVSRRRAVLAGAALAGAVSVKAWWVVPVVLVLVWWLVERRSSRRVGHVLLGAALVGLVLDAPFLLIAPTDMTRMLVSDQLGRPQVGLQGLHRAAHLVSLEQAFPRRGTTGLLVLLVGVALLGVALAAVAWRVRQARLVVVVVGAQVLVLVLAPSYFSFYTGYPAAALALTVAAAAAAPRGRRFSAGPALAGTALAAAAALTAVIALVHRPAFTHPVRGADELSRGVEDVDCLVSDSPMALIQLNALSRGLSHGCPNWIDVSGRTYDIDAPPEDGPQGRKHNARWQADLTKYLLSGDAVVLFRAETGADADTVRTIRSHPVLVRAGSLTVYRVR